MNKSADMREGGSDEDLIARVIAGDRDSYREIVERHQDRVFAMLMRQTGSRELAEELSQEVFIKAFFNLKSFRFESSFGTWLVRIALNTSHTYFSSRRFKSQRRTESLDPVKHEALAAAPQGAFPAEVLERFRIEVGKL